MGGRRGIDRRERLEASMKLESNLNTKGPGAVRDRRFLGLKRPNRFDHKKFKFSVNHLWGATAVILVVLVASVAELSNKGIS